MIIVIGILCLVMGALAARKGYNFWLWFFAFGGLGLIILAFLPYTNEPGNEKPEARKTGDTIGAILSVLGVLGLLRLLAAP